MPGTRASNCSRDWLKLGDYNYVDGSGFDPAAVDHDLNVVYGFKKKDGRKAVYTVALHGSQSENVIYSRPDVDVDDLIRIGRRNRVVGISYATDVRTAVYFDPDIEKLMKAHVAKVAPKGVKVRVNTLHGGHPWRAELNGPIYDAARRALRAAFGKEPVITGEGGSIPVVGDFQKILGAPVLLVGFGLPGENAHAPDEWMSDDNFRLGIRAVATLWDEYGGGGREAGSLSQSGPASANKSSAIAMA